MKEDLKNGIKVAAIITSLVLGAGFASGKEIISFFVNYGDIGIIGLLISGIIFAIAAIAVMDVCFRKKIDNYNNYIETVAGNKLGALMEGFLGLFLFVLFSAMVSAFGAIFKEAFNFHITIGISIAGVLCFIAFLFGMEGIIKINGYLSPIMIFGCIFIGLYTYFFKIAPAEEIINKAEIIETSGRWYISPILYASYNIITSVTVLSSLRKTIKSRKSLYISGCLAGILIFIIGTSLFLTLSTHKSLIDTYEIPLYALVGMYSKPFEILFLIVFITSVFTSAATNGYSFIQWFSARFGINKIKMSCIITVIACICALAGFSNFINVIYPIFGLIGFFEIILIIKKYIVS